jgi:hypothetical protein
MNKKVKENKTNNKASKKNNDPKINHILNPHILLISYYIQNI